MPKGNGTGPMGMGPMTGRAAGFCAGYEMPGYVNPHPGCGGGMGRGRNSGGCGGRRGHSAGIRAGRRNMFYATGLPGWARVDMPDTATRVPEQELALLKQQAEHFDKALTGIRQRIQAIETLPAEK